jgi:penicillin amidase
MSKRQTALIAGLAAVAGLLGAGYYWLLRRPLARTQGTLHLRGLQDKVEILRDPWGVPHIYAANLHDLMFAQGYVHAQDRLWQMDFHRRLLAGRLSEVLGEVTLPVDRWLRILGMGRVARQEASLLRAETLAALAAYAAGVSARIAQGRLPVEFTLLRFEPEPWTVTDTLAWIKFMSWSLSVNWESELVRAQLIDRLGPERAAELEPACPEPHPYIVPPGVDLAALGQAALDRAGAARPFTGPPPQAGLGSNNWVLDGTHTATGTPLLANDMHVLMNIPSIWYENHLVGANLNVTGVTFPGIPGVVAGHNGHVAWGLTAGFPDTQDLYMERLRRTADGGVQYEYQGEWHNAQVLTEEIRVKGGKPALQEVIITRHGPIINALAPDLTGDPSEPGRGLALCWTSLQPDTAIEAILDTNRAVNCLQFREGLRHWVGPVLNVVYADTGGNIAYSFPGKVPIRAKGDGTVPVPGWTGEYEWTGCIPFEELPHLYNPSPGYIATANNRTVADDYPYELGSEFCAGDRAQRITELIEAQEKIDIAYIQRMQFDQLSTSARAIARYLGQLAVDDPNLAAVVALMRDWDGTLAAESPAAAVYQLFTRRMLALMLEDKLGSDLAARYAGKGPTPVLQESSLFGQKARTWLQEMLSQPDSHWFDRDGGECRDDVMRLALRETVDYLKAELGPKIDDWAWGKLHRLTYAHILGRVKPLDRLFNRGPYPLGGDNSTLWATGPAGYDLKGESIIAPPFRFIADLGNLRNSWGMLSPGQSGQPGSKHYDDQIQDWFDGGYHPMLYDRKDVEEQAQAHLNLLPEEDT